MKKLFTGVLIASFFITNAQVAISHLPSASNPTGTEVLPMVQGGITKKVTVNQLRGGMGSPFYYQPLSNGATVIQDTSDKHLNLGFILGDTANLRGQSFLVLGGNLIGDTSEGDTSNFVLYSQGKDENGNPVEIYLGTSYNAATNGAKGFGINAQWADGTQTNQYINKQASVSNMADSLGVYSAYLWDRYNYPTFIFGGRSKQADNLIFSIQDSANYPTDIFKVYPNKQFLAGNVGIGVDPTRQLQVGNYVGINGSELQIGDLSGSPNYVVGDDGGAYMKLATGQQGSGKVWTSDDNGWGSWQHPDSALPYYKYVALLTQSDTFNPTVTVLENTIGDIVWTRTSAGIYNGSLSGAFTADKTFYIITPTQDAVTTAIYPSIGYSDTDNTIIYVSELSSPGVGAVSGNGVDGYLFNTPIEIRVYK